MPFEFRLPDIGEGVAEGEVVRWFVHEGDVIREDAPLVSVLTDKANVEIPSPKSGRILSLHAKEGQKVKVGGLLVTIATDDTAPAAAASPQPPTPSSPAGPEPHASAPTPPAGSGTGGAPPAGRILASPFVRRVAGELSVDLGAIRGSGPNGRILEEDVRRAAAPVSPGPATAAASAPAPVVPSATVPKRPESERRPSTGAAPGAVPPVVAPAPAAVSAPPGAAVPPLPATPNPLPAVPPAPEIERIPIRGLRRVISEHMSEAVHRAAHYTYVEEVDASELVRARESMATHLDKQGTKLTYLPFILKAVVAGLRAYPQMNATMDDERQELVVSHRYNIGIALATPDGLVVAVIRDADRKSLGEIARELQELGERGRTGKLTRAELTGSTFTITSLGALGGVLATPILNYPEVGILGVHHIVRRPVYKADGSIGPAHLMNLSVSLDHRVLDGIIGAQFLSVVRANLEDLHLLFAGLQ
ncbi:MAG: dihydrolipoamide acetyltransferase family protein [Thermoplasmata archaeon]